MPKAEETPGGSNPGEEIVAAALTILAGEVNGGAETVWGKSGKKKEDITAEIRSSIKKILEKTRFWEKRLRGFFEEGHEDLIQELVGLKNDELERTEKEEDDAVIMVTCRTILHLREDMRNALALNAEAFDEADELDVLLKTLIDDPELRKNLARQILPVSFSS